MDDRLVERLRAAGVDPDQVDDAHEAWLRLHQHSGLRATLIDRYALEAHVREVSPDELSPQDRKRIARPVIETRYPEIEIIGAERGSDTVEVVPYDPRWADRFAVWRTRLSDLLGPVALAIDHVGSTSVIGLSAKPIIDIQIVVPDVDDEDTYVPAIESTGTTMRAREPDHRYFRPSPGLPREVQIHVCDPQGDWGSEHLLFRDYLRAHRGAREEYASLKSELADRYRDDRLAYNEAKTIFILDTLEKARN